MSKISELAAISALDEDDVLVVVEDGTTKKVTVAELRAALGIDGWVPDTTTWTYVSASSFKISGTDVTARFPVGTRIRLKQGGSYKYFVVKGATFSTDTTVSVTAGDDYTVANSGITDTGYSYVASPQGYPRYFNYTPTFGGFSVAPSSGGGVSGFSVVGGLCTFFLHYNNQGTSNATSFTVSLPIDAVNTGGYYQTRAVNSGGQIQAMIELVAGTMNLYTSISGGSWVASGNKFVWFAFTYVV